MPPTRQGKSFSRQGFWMLMYLTWNRNWQHWNLLKRFSCAPEMVYRDLMLPYGCGTLWLKNLLTWTYIDPGVTGRCSNKALASGELHVPGTAKPSSHCSSWMWVLEHCFCSWGFFPSPNAVGSCLNFLPCWMAWRLWSGAVPTWLGF